MPHEQATSTGSDVNNTETCLSMQKEEFDVLEVRFLPLVAKDRSSSQSSTNVINSSTTSLSTRICIQSNPRWLREARNTRRIRQSQIGGLIRVFTLVRRRSSAGQNSYYFVDIRVCSTPTSTPHRTTTIIPLGAPPEIKSVRASNVWLPETKPLEAALIEMWQEGEPTLYNWVEFIRTGEFLHTLGILSAADSDIIACVIFKSRISLSHSIYVLLEDCRTQHRVLLQLY